MRLGIDASNLRAGGGTTHLIELLGTAEPLEHRFSQVVVWSGQATLNQIEDRPWLVKSHQPLLDRGLPYRAFWQRCRLSRLARMANCDVLFVPGGSYTGDFHPMVTMSRNLLPFEWLELRRYGWSLASFRLVLLRRTQSHTFSHADGLIFLSQYARDQVMRVIKTTVGKTTIVPHGVHERFSNRPRSPLPTSRYSPARPFRVLYVSAIDAYKHQWHVAKAMALLREGGLPVALDLVGSAYPPALKRLKAAQQQLDPAGRFIRYLGPIPHNELPKHYGDADACVYASSCENMPNILLESMASGLPIACSNRGSMRELLGDAGVFFDPENPDSIAEAVRTLFSSPPLRARLATSSFDRSQQFSWRKCAGETLEFLAEIASAQPTRPSQTGRT